MAFTIGSIGNILVLLVLCKKSRTRAKLGPKANKPNPTRILLINLAISDLIFLSIGEFLYYDP